MVRGEPQAVVDEVGVLLRELRLEAQRLLGQHHVLERPVRGMKDHRRGRLVDLARLDPDQAVLDLIDAAHTVLTAELVEALEREVQKLTADELAAFRDWFAEYDWQVWDRQIERDSAEGKLDKLAAEALAEFERGETREI